jgi:hypothetical protein
LKPDFRFPEGEVKAKLENCWMHDGTKVLLKAKGHCACEIWIGKDIISSMQCENSHPCAPKIHTNYIISLYGYEDWWFYTYCVRFMVYTDECRYKLIVCFLKFKDILNCYILFTWSFAYLNDKGLHSIYRERFRTFANLSDELSKTHGSFPWTLHENSRRACLLKQITYFQNFISLPLKCICLSLSKLHISYSLCNLRFN